MDASAPQRTFSATPVPSNNSEYRRFCWRMNPSLRPDTEIASVGPVGLANRIHQVFILWAQLMPEDAQRPFVAQQLLIAERQIIRTADGLELFFHLALTDEQRHIIAVLIVLLDRKTAEQGATVVGNLRAVPSRLRTKAQAAVCR